LQAKGNRIVGKHGRSVSLAGNSFFWSQWMPQYYTPEVVRWLKRDWRAGIVRTAVGIGPGGYLENPEAETARVSTVVDAAIAEGLYVVIDWHDHDAHKHEPQAIAFFQKMAQKYGKRPNVIYEIFNEPTKVSWAEVVKPYSERVIAAIRAIDKDNLILVGSPTWSQDVDVAAADPVKDPNVAYTLHFYAGTHKQWLRDKAERALDKGVALFVSEWGTCDANGNGKVDVESTRQWVEFMQKHRLSHLNWSVADKVEAASILRPGASTKGEWKEEDLTESGKLVRSIVRDWFR
jgi:endoglucanase